MTKQVRIENADTSMHKLVVYAERKAPSGNWIRDPAEPSIPLHHPTAMATLTVWDTKRLVIEEVVV